MSKPFAGIKVTHEECDVRSLTAVAETLDVYNPTTVILTAGVSHPGPVERASFEEEITTNLLGAFNVAQASIWAGVEKLIFIASVAGLHGKPNHAAYSASKAGVISLTQSLAHEGQIEAFAIAPGRVETPMRIKDYPDDTPGSRLSPYRVWETVKKCINDEYVSGACILIRKKGLTEIVEQVVPTPWRDELRVGELVTI
jgi:3-oxoacyl-[acyl-carrier protein] reductase